MKSEFIILVDIHSHEHTSAHLPIIPETQEIFNILSLYPKLNGVRYELEPKQYSNLK